MGMLDDVFEPSYVSFFAENGFRGFAPTNFRYV